MPCQDFGIGQSATNLFEGLQRVSMRRLAQEALAAQAGDTEGALAVYEKALFPRRQETARQSAEGLETVFNDRAPQPLIDMFTSFATD